METVYSVESEDGNEGKGEDKKDEKGEDGKENKCEEVKEEAEIEDDTSHSVTSSNKPRLVQMKRMESETTSYDWSTDSESLRYSNTISSQYQISSPTWVHPVFREISFPIIPHLLYHKR